VRQAADPKFLASPSFFRLLRLCGLRKIFSRRFASSIVFISVVEAGDGPGAYTPGSLPRVIRSGSWTSSAFGGRRFEI
jgi:hypothetical protein